MSRPPSRSHDPPDPLHRNDLTDALTEHPSYQTSAISLTSASDRDDEWLDPRDDLLEERANPGHAARHDCVPVPNRRVASLPGPPFDLASTPRPWLGTGSDRCPSLDTVTAGPSSFVDAESSSQALTAVPSGIGARRRKRPRSGRDGRKWESADDGCEKGSAPGARWAGLPSGLDPRGRMPFGRAWAGATPALCTGDSRTHGATPAGGPTGRSWRPLRRLIGLHFAARTRNTTADTDRTTPWRGLLWWYNAMVRSR